MTAGTVSGIEGCTVIRRRKGSRTALWVSGEGPGINLNLITVAVIVGIECFDGRKIFVIFLIGITINIHIVFIRRDACMTDDTVSFQE